MCPFRLCDQRQWGAASRGGRRARSLSFTPGGTQSRHWRGQCGPGTLTLAAPPLLPAARDFPRAAGGKPPPTPTRPPTSRFHSRSPLLFAQRSRVTRSCRELPPLIPRQRQPSSSSGEAKAQEGRPRPMAPPRRPRAVGSVQTEGPPQPPGRLRYPSGSFSVLSPHLRAQISRKRSLCTKHGARCQAHRAQMGFPPQEL